MIMKTNEELLEEFSEQRNHSPLTKKTYRGTIKLYCKIQEKSMHELLIEAEDEEDEGIRWKHRKLRTRLLTFRKHLIKNYLNNTVKTHMTRIQSLYRNYEIELHELPYISDKTLNKQKPISFEDLPTNKLLKYVLEESDLQMKAIILFMSSSGTARKETVSLTIQDFIDATKEYHDTSNIYEVINQLNKRKDIIPTFNIKRKKVNEYYYTFCTPEATTAILKYLNSIEKPLKPEMTIFQISPSHLSNTFIRLNNKLKLGKIGKYNRLRTHMIRKYHSTTLDNKENHLTTQDIDFLQGRSDTKTRQSYFFKSSHELQKKYALSMNDITINKKYNITVEDEEIIITERNIEQENKELLKTNKKLQKKMSKIQNIETELKKIKNIMTE